LEIAKREAWFIYADAAFFDKFPQGRVTFVTKDTHHDIFRNLHIPRAVNEFHILGTLDSAIMRATDVRSDGKVNLLLMKKLTNARDGQQALGRVGRLNDKMARWGPYAGCAVYSDVENIETLARMQVVIDTKVEEERQLEKDKQAAEKKAAAKEKERLSKEKALKL
jgi:hypothetical protein